MSDWARRTGQGWLLTVHAVPGAKTSRVAGLHGDALKVQVAAPPEKGRANSELVALLSDLLGVPKARVSVAKGESSRRKIVLVAAPQLDPARLLGPVPRAAHAPQDPAAKAQQAPRAGLGRVASARRGRA